MAKQNYAEWFEGLAEDERERVQAIVDTLRYDCANPEALMLADSRSEYALVARHHLRLDDDVERSYRSACWSIDALERTHEHADARFLKARESVRRMRALGVSEVEIMQLADHIYASAREDMSERIDDTACCGQCPEGLGWAVMELWNGKMTGRLVAGGKRFQPGGYDLEPWPDEIPRSASPSWNT